MTWKQLADKIAQMTEDQKNTDVTIVDPLLSEAFPVKPAVMTEESEGFGLDENHPYLMMNNDRLA